MGTVVDTDGGSIMGEDDINGEEGAGSTLGAMSMSSIRFSNFNSKHVSHPGMLAEYKVGFRPDDTPGLFV